CRARTFASPASTAESTMIGKSAIRLMRRHSSKPSMTGIMTPTTTRAGHERSRPARAAWPDAAVRTSKPSRVRRRARTEIRVWSSSTSRIAGRRAGSISNAAEAASHDCYDRRSQDHDEDRREDATHHGKEHLDRRLGCGLFRPLAPLDAELVRLDLQHLGDRDAKLLGLDNGANKVVDRLRIGALGDV